MSRAGMGRTAMAASGRWLPALVALLVLPGGPAWSQGSGSPSAAVRVFKSANCAGCHHWTGTGGGGYGGASANLRATQLTSEQIVETIRCGRPGTAMPHFERDAYADGRCFGLKAEELATGQKPPEPDHYLRPADIELVARYVVEQLKGRGAPTFAECQAFFGTRTRACDTYREAGAKAGASDASSVAH